MRHRFAVEESFPTGHPAHHGGRPIQIATFARLEDALDFVALKRLSGRMLSVQENRKETK